MSWTQISATVKRSGSDQSMHPRRPRSSSRGGQQKGPIIVIASPHPTIVTSNMEPGRPTELSAEMTPAASPMQASVIASIAGQDAGSMPVRHTSSGSLIVTANIKVTTSGTTFVQDARPSSPVHRRKSSAGSKGSHGRSTPSGFQPRRGSQDTLQLVGVASSESMGCSGVFGMQMAGNDLFQHMADQGTQQQAMQQHGARTSRGGSRRGSRRSFSRGSSSPSATSLSAVAQYGATPGGAGQRNLVVNIPTPQDPTGNSLTVTIVQDAGSAAAEHAPSPQMTMSGTAIMRHM